MVKKKNLGSHQKTTKNYGSKFLQYLCYSDSLHQQSHIYFMYLEIIADLQVCNVLCSLDFTLRLINFMKNIPCTK